MRRVTGPKARHGLLAFRPGAAARRDLRWRATGQKGWVGDRTLFLAGAWLRFLPWSSGLVGKGLGVFVFGLEPSVSRREDLR